MLLEAVELAWWWSSCLTVITVPVSALCEDLINCPSGASWTCGLVTLPVASATFDRIHLSCEVFIALAACAISTRSGIALNISC